MEVFRLAKTKHTKTLSASGVAARWNKDNQFVLYTGATRSLTTLELIVHRNSISAVDYKIMTISISDDEALYSRVSINRLPPNWKNVSAYNELQKIGDDWYSNKKSLILQVPSVIIPQEFNYIINIYHPDFSPETVSLVRAEDYFWDDRLF
ncbi:MAG: RES family NAD+ phosphorylase [Vicingus serpentipes]|nr:RES family NAD+ phosphorylase [Vicingus serpentipes]